MGAAIARDLARAGWHVAIHHRRSVAEATALADEIVRAGGTAGIVTGDLAAGDVSRVVDDAVATVGPLGLLVNNASVFEWDDLDHLDAASWHRHQDVNARAPLLLAQAFARRLPEGAGGSIVNILDARVLRERPRHLSYTISKSTLWTITRLLAQELAPRVRVNAIGPGPTLPESGKSDAEFAQRCAELPLGRPASLDEICLAVRFLVQAGSVTGQLLALDGGDHLA
jgi:NAD(P)-dependent dehydrogenase (short-subunit alcohol dehydrogenase family)